MSMREIAVFVWCSLVAGSSASACIVCGVDGSEEAMNRLFFVTPLFIRENPYKSYIMREIR